VGLLPVVMRVGLVKPAYGLNCSEGDGDVLRKVTFGPAVLEGSDESEVLVEAKDDDRDEFEDIEEFVAVIEDCPAISDDPMLDEFADSWVEKVPSWARTAVNIR